MLLGNLAVAHFHVVTVYHLRPDGHLATSKAWGKAPRLLLRS